MGVVSQGKGYVSSIRLRVPLEQGLCLPKQTGDCLRLGPGIPLNRPLLCANHVDTEMNKAESVFKKGTESAADSLPCPHPPPHTVRGCKMERRLVQGRAEPGNSVGCPQPGWFLVLSKSQRDVQCLGGGNSLQLQTTPDGALGAGPYS